MKGLRGTEPLSLTGMEGNFNRGRFRLLNHIILVDSYSGPQVKENHDSAFVLDSYCHRLLVGTP